MGSDMKVDLFTSDLEMSIFTKHFLYHTRQIAKLDVLGDSSKSFGEGQLMSVSK